MEQWRYSSEVDVQRKKQIKPLADERRHSLQVEETTKARAGIEPPRRKEQATLLVENGDAGKEVGGFMGQPEPSGFRIGQGGPSQQMFPEQGVAEALGQIHVAAGSFASGRAGSFAAALQAMCQAVKNACMVDMVQLWLLENSGEPQQGPLRLKRQVSAGDGPAPVGLTVVDLTTDLALARLLSGGGYALRTLTKEASDSPLSAMFPGFATALLVPLVSDGKLLGMLALLGGRAAGGLTPHTASLAEALAGHVALAVQNAQLMSAAQARAAAYERGLSAVARAAEAITSTLHLSEVAEQIVSVICSTLRAQAAWLMTYDEANSFLRVEAVFGWEAIRGTEIVPEKSVAGEVLSSRRPVFVPDVQANPRFAVKREAKEAGIVAMFGMPLFAQGRIVGVLGLNPSPDADGLVRNPLDGPDGDWLRLFADQAGVAVQNAQLYESLQAERALAEQWAHASQRHAGEMETIFESMAEGVAVFDTSGRLVRLNRAGAELAGLSAAKLLKLSPTALGTGISETVASKDFALLCHPLIMRALAGAVVTGEGLALPRADGSQVFVNISASPLSDKQGEVTGAVAILEDVTERQEYQREQLAVGWVAAALNHSLDLKETLDTAVEALTAALGADDSAIMLVDEAQGVLRVVSERGYGISRRFPVLPLDAPLHPSLAFQTRKVRVYESDALGDHPLHQMLIQAGFHAGLSAPLLVQDQALGVLVYSYARPHHFSANEQQVARAIADQIALAVLNARLYEEVADYAAWQENERRTLQIIIDALPAGIILREKGGKLFMYNEAALKLARNRSAVLAALEDGQTPVEPVWETIRPDGTLLERDAFPSQLAIESGTPVQELQLYVRQEDGRAVPILLNAVPMQDAEGAFTRGLSVFQDITALKELERHKDEFISVASHELRGPLTVIRGQAQLLQRQLRRQEKQGELPPGLQHLIESMESIESQTARLNDLVNDLLDVSRIQAGKLVLKREAVPLAPLIKKVIEHWKPASDHHALISEIEMATEDVIGHWDARRVEQILNNLLGNALKYSPEGGNVHIQVQVDRAKKQVLIRIRDEGLGIPPEALPHLFERFYRAGNVSSIGGTGLGLYISRQLAVAHGGDLRADSAGLGKGSTFSLRLPIE
jgi:PAS domain S-box-containing protein